MNEISYLNIEPEQRKLSSEEIIHSLGLIKQEFTNLVHQYMDSISDKKTLKNAIVNAVFR